MKNSTLRGLFTKYDHMVTEFQHVMSDIVLLSQAGDFSQAYGSTLSVTRYNLKGVVGVRGTTNENP